jgi:hypothetical protein
LSFLIYFGIPVLSLSLEEELKGRGEPIRSEHSLPGAFEKDVFPAIVLAGAAGTFRVSNLIFHISDELHLVAETGRPGAFLS